MRLRHHRATLLSLLLLVALPLVHGAGAHRAHAPGSAPALEAPADDVAVAVVDEGCTLCAASRGSFDRLADAPSELALAPAPRPVSLPARLDRARSARVVADAPRAPPHDSPRPA